MKAIETPAFRLTASNIWNSFRNSKKRHIFITGSRQSGKTTLLNELFITPVPSIITRAEQKKAVYMTSGIGETTKIGVYDPSLPGCENKMRPCTEEISSFGASALYHLAEEKSDWAVIDEIGYLECDNEIYKTALLSLLEKKHVAAVIRKQNLPFLNELINRTDCLLIDTDNPFGNCGCVIMASGLGKRFGSNKLMADFKGKPLINSILECTKGIFTDRVVVTRHKDVYAYCEKQTVKVVLHNLPNRNDTIRLGLNAMDNMDRVMFCPADQPLLSRETVISLALCSNNTPFIWRTEYLGTHSAPIIFPSQTYPELLTLPEGKGGNIVVKKHPESLRTVSVQSINELKDIDYPIDLKSIENA